MLASASLGEEGAGRRELAHLFVGLGPMAYTYFKQSSPCQFFVFQAKQKVVPEATSYSALCFSLERNAVFLFEYVFLQGAIRGKTVLQAVELPAGVTNLDTGL